MKPPRIEPDIIKANSGLLYAIGPISLGICVLSFALVFIVIMKA